LKFKDHKDPLVRKTTISLIPILAGFNPKAFNLSHLQPCASYMLTVMKKEKGAERSAAFLGMLQPFIAVMLHASHDVLQHLESSHSILNRPASCNLWISLLFISKMQFLVQVLLILCPFKVFNS
jgi:hypothetical protein